MSLSPQIVVNKTKLNRLEYILYCLLWDHKVEKMLPMSFTDGDFARLIVNRRDLDS